MRTNIVRVGPVAALLVSLLVQGHLTADSALESLEQREGAAIFERVERANAEREARLRSYESMRQYTVWEPGHAPDAELVVSMRFVAPSEKTFGEPAERGVGWIHKRVFHGLMRAEQEAANGRERTENALVPANYAARLVGEESCGDRDCYVLALEPRRRSKYLLTGKVWIDKSDLAIARIEGEPIKSPSMWVERAHIVREYDRVEGFWLPTRDETHCAIRFVGEYVLAIKYFDYRVVP